SYRISSPARRQRGPVLPRVTWWWRLTTRRSATPHTCAILWASSPWARPSRTRSGEKARLQRPFPYSLSLGRRQRRSGSDVRSRLDRKGLAYTALSQRESPQALHG